jgi:thioredoxin-like negative regulator of GroEL
MYVPDSLLADARAFLADGDLGRAEAAADAVLAVHPEYGPGWCLKGEIRRRLSDAEGCIQALEAASLQMELPAEMQLHLAECYASAGRSDLAKWLMRDVPAKADATDCIVLKTACALGRLGASDEALDLCRDVFERSPDRHEAAFGVAYYMNRVGKESSDVLPYLRAAYDLDPRNTMYRVSLALCLNSLGRTEAAYAVVADLDLARVEWPHCLTRLMEIFAGAGDQSRYLDCQARLRQLGDPNAGGKCGGDPERQ